MSDQRRMLRPEDFFWVPSYDDGIPDRSGPYIRAGRWWVHDETGELIPIIAGGTNVFALTQRAFAFYEDGSETGASPFTESANITRYAGANSALQLRLSLQESGAGSISGASTDDYQLQYSKNAGAFTNVTGASSNVRGFASTLTTDADPTTQRLSAGTGSFVAGKISEDGLVDNHQITANNFTELLYDIEVVAADTAESDTLDFRVLLNGATTNMTYTVTPRLTVTKVLSVPQGAQSNRVTQRPSSRLVPIAALLFIAPNLLGNTLAEAEPPAETVYTSTQTTILQAPPPIPFFQPPNLLGNTLAPAPAQDPFAASTWGQPRAIDRRGRDDQSLAPPLALIQAQVPFTPTASAQPRVSRNAPESASQNLLSTLLAQAPAAAPFTPTNWPVPRRPSQLITTVCTIPGDIPAPPAPSGDPFVSVTYPNGTRWTNKVALQPLQWTRGTIDQLVPYRYVDLGDNWPVPPRGHRGVRFDPPNLLASTLAPVQVQNPFTPAAWARPQRLVRQHSPDASNTILRLTQLAPVVPPQAIQPRAWDRRAQQSHPQNLQGTTLAQAVAQNPFTPSSWETPRRSDRKQTQDAQNTILRLIGLAPVTPTAWAVPTRVSRPASTDAPNLLGTTLVPAAAQAPFTPSQWTQPRIALAPSRADAVNLLESTLAPSVPAVPSVWTLPRRARAVQPTFAQANNLLETTFAPIPPFCPQWENPRITRPVIDHSWTITRPFYYVEPSDFPPGDVEVQASYTPSVTLDGSTAPTIDCEGSVDG